MMKSQGPEGQQNKERKGTAEQTLQMMQCGNLDLNFPIKYGTLLLGNTKAGKTTTAHYLMHTVLRGSFNNDNYIVYKFNEDQCKFPTAKIGQKQSVSETQIPNFFDYNYNGEKAFLVDCPGYLDSFGCFRIISNRFFHFQVFSKIENIKFIITFCWNDMQKKAPHMLSTFQQFLSGFDNLEQIKKQIINATSIMITNVPEQYADYQTVKKRFTNTPTYILGSLLQFYQELKQNIIKNDRIYIFQRAKLGNICDSQNKILQKINQSGAFWKRKINQNGQVDMKNIKISIAEYLKKEQNQFSFELKQFKQFYQTHFRQRIPELIKVIYEFSEDNMRGQQSFGFIKQLMRICEQKRKWRQSQQCKCNFIYLKYAEKRNKFKKQMFKQERLFDFQSSEYVTYISQMPIWLVKLKSLLKIQNILAKEAHNEFKYNFGFQKLNQQTNNIKKILEILINLTKHRKLKDQKQNKLKNQMVVQFAYQTLNVLQISNKLFRLINTTINKQSSQDVSIFENGMHFILTSYPKQVQNIFLKAINKKSTQIFLQNYSKMRIQDNLTQKASAEVAKFLKQFKIIIQNQNQLNKKISRQAMNNIVSNLDNTMTKLSVNSLNYVKKLSNPNLSVLREMQEKRAQIDKKIYECKLNAFYNERLVCQHNRIVHVMAECLVRNNFNQLSLQLYQSLFDADKVFEIMQVNFQNIQRSQKKNQQNLYLQHYIDFMKKARKYHRKQLALTKAQKAYHIAQDTANNEKISEISNFIRQLCTHVALQEDTYMQALFKQIVQAKISKQTSQKILNISSKAIPNKK